MAPHKHNPPLILVADDQKATTLMLERVFSYDGYQVKSVYDGLSAVIAANEYIPDLILLDINMPGKNGFEVLQQLRENPRTMHIPTMIITAMGDSSHVVEGLNLGADDYLRKPFYPQELLARARSKIKAYRLERTLHRRTQELEILLQIGHQLNQQLNTNDLLDLIIQVMQTPPFNTLIASDFAGYLYLGNNQELQAKRIFHNLEQSTLPDITQLISLMNQNQEAYMWNCAADAWIDGFDAGIVQPIHYIEEMRGILFVTSQEHFDESDKRVLQGFASQIALALHNAELYDIKVNYATKLEQEVAKRTAELESTQQMLIRSEKLASVGRLAASIAHEINNPLFPIQINLEDMLEDLREGKGIQESDILKTLESVERIKYVVSRLLEFTGNRQNDHDKLVPLDLNQIIQHVIGLNQKFFRKNNVEIQQSLSDIPQIYGNKYQLEHVFMNLALNANDAMQDTGGILSFQTYTVDNQVIAVVEDNGLGIPEPLLDDIFEPFFTTKRDGNGLGLFISYGIIQKHHGEIKVESEPGKGTRFTLIFPTI